jgi:hypothetical protein
MLVLLSHTAFGQRGMLFVKKKGFKKVYTFVEGEAIRFRTDLNREVRGAISLIKGDSLRVNGIWFRTAQIKKIILRDKKGITGPFLLTSVGVGLTAAGMTLANWASFGEAVAYASVIGYGNYVVQNFIPALKRKQFRIGKKFNLQTVDLRF